MRKLNEQLKKYVLKSNPGDAKGIEATIEVKLTGSKMKFLNELQRLCAMRPWSATTENTCPDRMAGRGASLRLCFFAL